MSKPTIVLGTLNDSELTTAIDNLVKHVEDKSREMANYFDSQINRMKTSLNGLGNVNINLGGAGTADKQISSQFKETTATIKDILPKVIWIIATALSKFLLLLIQKTIMLKKKICF